MENQENVTIKSQERRKLKIGRKLQERGITLVALVVTIIILLILAGVTLNLALGEGGIFARAKNTVDRYQAAQANEVDQLAQFEEMLNNYGQGESTGGSTGGGTGEEGGDEPSDGTESSEVADDLKTYQGKFVDIGVNINGNDTTADDWELFYATKDKIFLIAADYVPSTTLSTLGVIGAGTTLNNNGFDKTYSTYNVYWSTPKNFSTNLPNLTEVMHTGYDLTSHQSASDYNSIAVSHLLDTNAWSGIKTASGEKGKYIDYAIGGPTLEMWCEAWNKAVEGDDTFKQMKADPQTDGTGYKVSSNGTSGYGLYVNGTSGTQPDQTKLSNYKTFFPHPGSSDYNGCYGYWLASPSAGNSDSLMCVSCRGDVGSYGSYSRDYLGVRPVVSLASGVQIVERADADNIYDVTK